MYGNLRPAVDPERTIALVVAVDTYADPSIEDRPGLAASADRFAGWVRERGVPEGNIIRLGGERPATAATVDGVLTGEIPNRDGTLLWIFWAGHGFLDAEGRRRLLLADADQRNLRTLDLDALLLLYRSAYLNGFDRQLVVVDACQSDVPIAQGGLWPPLALPRAGVSVRTRSQRVWLATSAGERAAYAGGQALFSTAVLDVLSRSTDLDWRPDDDEVRAVLRRTVSDRLPGSRPQQNPITLMFQAETGETRTETVTPSTEPRLFRPSEDRPVAEHAVLAAYLRWLAHTHEHVEAQIADSWVRAPLAESPWTGELVIDDSTDHVRGREVDYLRTQRARAAPSGDDARGPRLPGPQAAELRELAARPYPTYLTPIRHVDQLDLSDRLHLPAETVLDRFWRAVILGDPGSGKTTLVRELARRRAGETAMDGDPRRRLPVLCRAADLADALAADGAASGGDALPIAAITVGWFSTPPFDPLSGETLPAGELAELVRSAGARGRLLLIVDALDEVPTREQRGFLVDRLTALVKADGARYGVPTGVDGNQVLITSRLVGYYATPFADPVRHLMLRPMTADAARETGLYWLNAFAAAVDQEAGRTGAIEQQFLEAAASEDQAGHRLIDNPYLLISLLSAVVTGELGRRRPRNRPLSRSDLYGFMVDDAVARAVVRRPELATRPVHDLQFAIAYAMHRSSRTGVFDPAALRACAQSAVEEMGGDADDAVSTIKQLGLLTARGQDLYGFLHQTLEEYLAGRWLVKDGAAARVETHLGDPRWVEPIRLGLGHLSRTAPATMDALLTALLTGPSGEAAAGLLADSLPELDTVQPAHIEAAVTSLLAADEPRVHGGDHELQTVETLRVLLTTPVALRGGGGPVEVVSRVLADTLRKRDAPWLVATAALAVEGLNLFTRETAEALFDAQDHDRAEYGWATVRALHTMAGEIGGTLNRDAELAKKAWRGLSDDDQAVLSTVTVVRSSGTAESGLRRSLIPMARTPMRERLRAGLAERVAADPALVRMVLCLYDGVEFRDRRRWLAEQARLRWRAELGDAEPATRLDAAVRLDTVVAAALAGRPEAGSQVPDTDRIVVDSPLSERLCAWLEEGSGAGVIAGRLRRIAADPGETAEARGDALAGWCALWPDELARDPSGVIQHLEAGLTDPVRARMAWRMERARLLLGDAAASISPGDLVDAFGGQPVDSVTGFSRTVTRALDVVGGRAPASGTWKESLAFSPELLVALVCGTADDKNYSLAVVLDTKGSAIMADGPDGLASILVKAPAAAPAYSSHRTDWDLDPLGPWSGDPYPEALTVIDGLRPQFDFLRCWLLDRLAPALVERGLGVEAICLAKRAEAGDPVSAHRTIVRLLGLMPEFAPRPGRPPATAHDPMLPALLTESVTTIRDAYIRARAQLRLARTRGLPMDSETVAGLAYDINDSLQRLRLVELACSLRLVKWDARLRIIAKVAIDRLTGAERVLAQGRITARASGSGGEPRPDRPAAPARDTRDEMMRVLAAAAEAGTQPDAPAPSPSVDELASLAASLLEFESARAVPGALPAPWSVLTAATICNEILAQLRRSPGERVTDWTGLTDPRTRQETRQAILRSTRTTPHDLTPADCEVIETLRQEGQYDLVEELLVRSRLTGPSAIVESWRACEHERVADLATLLTVETGSLDEAGVCSLPRLLADGDDRVRMRTGIATAQVSRGGDGRPPFSATVLGAATLARLVTTAAELRRTGDRAEADLVWALNDVVHDSSRVIGQTLDLLTGDDERRLFLGSITQVNAETLLALAGLLPDLTEAEQLRLLRSIDGIASHPRRYGITPEVVVRLSDPLLAVAADASDQVAARALAVLGEVLEPEEHLSLLAEQVSLGLDPAEPETVPVGAAEGLGVLLGRVTTTDVVKAAHCVEVLRAAASDPNDRLALAGIAGLIRAGHRQEVMRLLSNGTIDDESVLWGMLAALKDHLIGPEYRDGIRQIAGFVYQTSGSSTPRSAPRRARRLIEALLEYVVDHLDPDVPADPASTPLSVALTLERALGVLVECAREQVAGVREPAARFPELPARLARYASSGETSWVGRQHALRLLVLLGTGDRTSVRAIVGAGADIASVRQATLRELIWFDRVEPDGFEELLATVGTANLARCHLAVQILLSLLRFRSLDDEAHRTALIAVRGCLDRPDADEPLLIEDAGEIRVGGTFSEAVRAALTRLNARPRPARTARSRRRFQVRVLDRSGAPIDLVAPSDGAPGAGALSHQIRYYQSLGREVPFETVTALGNSANAARGDRVAWESVLEAGRTGA